MRNFAKIEIPDMGTWFIDVSDYPENAPYRIMHYRDGHRDSPIERYESFESCFQALSQQIKGMCIERRSY